MQQISLVQTFKAQPHHTSWIQKEVDRDALVEVKPHTSMKHRLKGVEKIYKGSCLLKTRKNQLANKPTTCKHLKDAIFASYLVWVFAADKQPTVHTRRLPYLLYANSSNVHSPNCSTMIKCPKWFLFCT